MPAPVREVVSAALRDLQQPRPLSLRVDDSGALWVQEHGEPAGRFGLVSPEPDQPSELLADFAHWLTDQIFPESRGAWGEARPRCPGHRHPAQAELIDGQAWWTCPLNDRRVAPIGQFAAATERTATDRQK
jgi:hypothetical protein